MKNRSCLPLPTKQPQVITYHLSLLTHFPTPWCEKTFNKRKRLGVFQAFLNCITTTFQPKQQTNFLAPPFQQNQLSCSISNKPTTTHHFSPLTSHSFPYPVVRKTWCFVATIVIQSASPNNKRFATFFATNQQCATRATRKVLFQGTKKRTPWCVFVANYSIGQTFFARGFPLFSSG